MITDELNNNVDMINAMLAMQKKLDSDIMQKKGIKYGEGNLTEDNINLAIIDELGELNHELKGLWCWWKEHQDSPDHKKVLEELVDLWHFVLMKHYLVSELGDYTIERLAQVIPYIATSISDYHFIYTIGSSAFDIDDVIALTYSLGFEISDVHRAYMEKNRINHERLERGY